MIEVLYPIDRWSWDDDNLELSKVHIGHIGHVIGIRFKDSEKHLWRSKIQINGFINTDRRRNVRKDRCRDYRYHLDELWGDTEEDHDFNPDHYEDIFELRRLFGIFPYLPYTCEKEKPWI